MMGPKRAADDDGPKPATEKRQRPSTAAAPPHTSKRSAQAPDLTYGQRAAFGDLADATVPTGDDLEWEDETDALAYLRRVRQEARGIPNVLAASRGPQQGADRSIYDDGRGDFRGYYHDGAYVAFPDGYRYGDEEEEEEEEEDEDGDYEGEEGQDGGEGDEDDSEATSPDRPRNSNSAEIHEAYFASLIAQYEALRQLLHSKPPDHILAALPRENTPDVGSFGASSVTFKQWSGRMRNTDPLPAQVASMHKDGVFRLLRIILGANFFRKGHELRERTSRWLWALLARLPGKGELDYQEIGWIRELGKRAILSMVSLAEAEILQQEYGVGSNAAGEGEDGADPVDADHGHADEETRQRISADHSADQNPKTPRERMRSQSPHVPGGNAAADQLAAGARGTPAEQAPAKTGDEAASPPDVEMQDDSDMEDEGEVSADPPPQREPSADLETAKLRLLARLSGEGEAGQDGPYVADPAVEQVPEPAEVVAAEDGPEERAKANVRATLNMILTVAGEFYGQRDLLEFRDPFDRVLEESV